MNDIHDDQPEATFGYIAERLSDYRFAYLHIVNPAIEQMQSGKEPDPRGTRHGRDDPEEIQAKPDGGGRLRGRLPQRGGFAKARRT